MGRQAKPSRKRRWLVMLVELLVIIAIVFAIRAWQQRTLVSGEAPHFELNNLAGEEVRLADYHGQAVMLYFWASWCKMCELQQSGINRVTDKWPVLTVAYLSGDHDDVTAYMQRRDVAHWNTMIDKDGELAEAYGVIAVPTSYIIDAQGNIRFREVGLSSSWGLRLRLWWASRFSGKAKDAAPALTSTDPSS